MKYDITYKDDHGTIKGIIENKFAKIDYTKDYSLELELGNVFFKGDSFDGLAIQNEDKYRKEQLSRLT